MMLILGNLPGRKNCEIKRGLRNQLLGNPGSLAVAFLAVDGVDNTGAKNKHHKHRPKECFEWCHDILLADVKPELWSFIL